MTIYFYIKDHLGQKRLYVRDNDQRMWLMKVTKRATITPSHKKALEKLGIKFIQVEAPRED